MDKANEIITRSLKSGILSDIQENKDIAALTNLLSDSSNYHIIVDQLDESGKLQLDGLNDIEMMYLFVHQERDMNEAKNKKKNTKREYIRDLLLMYKHFWEQADLLELSLENVQNYHLFQHLNARHLRKYQTWLKTAPLGKSKKPYSVATTNRKMVLLKGLFSFLHDHYYLKEPLHKYLKSSNVRLEDRPLKDLTLEEVSVILSSFKRHPILHGLLSVLITTGIRIQELCTAKVNSLSYINGEYWLTVLGKGDKPREVLIHPNVLQAIIRFRERRGLDLKLVPNDDSPLFTTSKGKAYEYKYLSNYLIKKINQLDHDFIKLRTQRITPHFFRHAFALISSEQGVNIQFIQESLGHNNIATTMIYLKRAEMRRNHAAHAWKDSDIINNI